MRSLQSLTECRCSPRLPVITCVAINLSQERRAVTNSIHRKKQIQIRFATYVYQAPSNFSHLKNAGSRLDGRSGGTLSRPQR